MASLDEERRSSAAESDTQDLSFEGSLRKPGQEPLPGYRLVEPLGRGGFGEVWKCMVSGGLAKAIKFVDGAQESATGLQSAAAQELAALERVKSIRHPFILSIERIEVIQGVLIIVMELADRNLQAELLEHQVQGHSGIPRDELLGFLAEAAEALDEMNFKHGLQHLDVKPHNLFVIGSHVKVGDFGLVHSLGGNHRQNVGLTPLYAAPERYQQSISPHSDQYSLAIVYQQMLTATVPFASPEPHQLRMQHLTGSPDLSALSAGDRAVVSRALAKDPEKRFSSCQEFVRALVQGNEPASPQTLSRSTMINRLRQALRDREESGKQPARPATPSRPDLPTKTTVLPPAELDTPAPEPRIAPPRTPSKASASPVPQAFQRTCVQVPGYRFLNCVGQNPLGELWTIEDSAGEECLGFSLIPMAEESAQALTRLQALEHPGLVPGKVFWSPAGRLVLVTDPKRKTLRSAFEQYQKDGQIGIPRLQLLTWLRSAAAALDELVRAHGLFHLGLNPGNMVVEGDRLWLADFGLVPLVWLPTAQASTTLNQRYAPPELGDNIVSSSSDQYSLALIFAEMLTGIYPRTNRLASRSGAHRRPSGPAGRTANPPRMNRVVDLDFLPTGDREILAQALDNDPEQRFPTCTALIEALEAVTVVATRDEADPLAGMPPVILFECLLGKPVREESKLPLPEQVVARWLAAAIGLSKEENIENIRFWRHPDGIWEHRCLIQFQAGLTRYKVEGFRQQWNAQTVSEEGTSYVFKIVTEAPSKRSKPACSNEESGLEIAILFDAASTAAHLCETTVCIRAFGDDRVEMGNRHRQLVPRLLQSLRGFLQASQEQRAGQRWPFTGALSVCPMLPSLEVPKVLEGRGCNLSRGGMNFLVPKEIPSEFVYLHLPQVHEVSSLAVLARVVHIQPTEDDWFEVGVTFQIEAPPAS